MFRAQKTKEGDVRKMKKALKTLWLYIYTHTGDLLENKNNINKRDICTNA